MQQGDLEAAVAVLRELTVRDPRERRGVLQPRRRAEAARTTSRAQKRRCARAVDLAARWRTRRSRWASCCGRPVGPPRRSTMFRKAIARGPRYAEAHYMLGTVLAAGRRSTTRRCRSSGEAIRLRPSSAEAHLSLGQTPAAAAAMRAGAAAAFDEADRLNRKKADVQASTFAVGVGRRELQERRPRRRHRAVRARRARSRPTTSRRTTSSRKAFAAGRRDAARTHTSPRRAVSRRTCGSADP